MFSLICAWIGGWVNNGEAGDLWRRRAHYNVTVMEDISIYMDSMFCVPLGYDKTYIHCMKRTVCFFSRIECNHTECT